MHDYPPPGAYIIEDPYLPGTASCWTIDADAGLEPWPLAAKGKYGPPRPARSTPARSVEQRRDVMNYWRAQVEVYRLEVLTRIAADPAGAAARFAQTTERCPRCRRAQELPAAARTTPGREPLSAAQRDAMVVDLRRAGHPEALIAQALGIGSKTVNRAARKAGIGAPLKPRPAATLKAGR